ncbi:MAG: (2Fe-2S) ferredoxin domain-containing protein [Capsulimonadales bacterium]|nr:(2Fe-2S) ferredoxin domain-containing protein [Capsulimonadales bacterium]
MAGSDAPCLRVCCGPRCGTVRGHRTLFRLMEAQAAPLGYPVRPTMCQGRCGDGVTVILPDGTVRKIRSAEDARLPNLID